MSGKCAVCGNKIAFHATKIKDGNICAACRVALPLKVYNNKEEYTAKQIYEIIHEHDGEEPRPLFCFGDAPRYGEKPKPQAAPAAPVHERDKYDEIREYKKLLDEGIITEEEFISKKKELLGL